MHMGQGTEEHDINPSGLVGGWVAGHSRKGGEKTCGRKRQAEGGRDPRTGEPLGTIGQKRGGKIIRGVSHRLARGTPWGGPAREGSANERWRLAGGAAIQVDGGSAPGQVREEKRVQRESKVALKGERWGIDRS